MLPMAGISDVGIMEPNPRVGIPVFVGNGKQVPIPNVDNETIVIVVLTHP
jgi:hypothetical protein